MQHTLTSLLCPHSYLFAKVSYSILVCCSHRHIVGRVGHQTRNVIRQFHMHPSKNSDCFIEHVIHIVRRIHSSVLHLISGQTVVVGWKGDKIHWWRCSNCSNYLKSQANVYETIIKTGICMNMYYSTYVSHYCVYCMYAPYTANYMHGSCQNTSSACRIILTCHTVGENKLCTLVAEVIKNYYTQHSAIVLYIYEHMRCARMLTEGHSRLCPSHQHSGGTSAEGTDALRHWGHWMYKNKSASIQTFYLLKSQYRRALSCHK